MQTTNRIRILFIFFVVLGIYYPVIFAGVNSVDDFKMISSFEDIQHIDWKGLFVPGQGYYYRPILLLSFMADKFIWGLEESFMHLENIIIHAVNACLLFVVALKVFPRPGIQKLELPLLSALLFALHPINTEAVAWISGRTDPLATLFVLLSLLVLIKGLEQDNRFFLLCSTLLLLMGGMCKEVAVFFFPVSCVIAYFWRNDDTPPSGATVIRKKLVRLLAVASPFLLGGIGYLIVRFVAHGSSDKGIAQILKGYHYDVFNTIRVIFKVFGFYVKKLFVPLPLNFAILRLDDSYVWLGIATTALLILLFIAFRQQMVAVYFVSSFYLISPAILVALSRIAWTPVAERYLYLPSALFSIGLVGGVYNLLDSRGWTRMMLPIMALLLFPAAGATVQRNITWQDNLSLYQDTMEKSPGHAVIRNELAIALIEKGRNTEAGQQIELGKGLDHGRKNFLLYVNQAKMRYTEGNGAEARRILLQTFTAKADANPEVLKMLSMVDEQRLYQSKSKSELASIQREIMDTHEHLYPKTGDPMSLYRGGQMALFLGEKKKAAELFRKAYQVAPEDAYYKKAALKLAEKLSK